jgi:hypothetical protein
LLEANGKTLDVSSRRKHSTLALSDAGRFQKSEKARKKSAQTAADMPPSEKALVSSQLLSLASPLLLLLA